MVARLVMTPSLNRDNILIVFFCDLLPPRPLSEERGNFYVALTLLRYFLLRLKQSD